MARSSSPPAFGALVVSLDFELHWGVRDHQSPHGAYRRNLLGARDAVPRMLELFSRYEIAATWAVVGFLFAEDRAEMEALHPAVLPEYRNRALSPFGEVVGADEDSDPLHFAPSLIDRISAAPRQEVGSHTFSHYYCLEAGQTRAAFRADLDSAVKAAGQRGLTLKSLVFPRNQHQPAYDDILKEAGISAFRGPAAGWCYKARREEDVTPMIRAARLLDVHHPLSSAGGYDWSEVLQPNGLANVRASLFLRPVSSRLSGAEALRFNRIKATLKAAARQNKVVHIWWHPHNFGVRLEENLSALERLLQVVSELRDQYGMRSLTMEEVAVISRGAGS